MKTSARNHLTGTIKHVNAGVINADVIVDLGQGLEIVANITNNSVRDLALAPGKRVDIVINSSQVLLSPDINIRTSAGNTFIGTVKESFPGAINAVVKVEIENGIVLTATITNNSLEECGLTVGSPCSVLINASYVVLAINGG